jgi:hypothetical protein
MVFINVEHGYPFSNRMTCRDVNSMNQNKGISFFLYIVLFILVISLSNADTLPGMKYNNGTVLAVYVIGSDLEYNRDLPYAGGAASNDITEIITGYGSGAPGLDVLIAYGGSLKPGWKGITIATPEQVKDDLIDNQIGVNATYLMRDEKANMADKKTLTTFLQYVASHSPGKRILLVFWNHGAAWDGFGMDSNFIDPISGDRDLLSLEEMKDALQESGNHYDLIGFDACLMANLEVVSSVASYGDVLVASEEVEPGFGWDWVTTVKKLGENPSIDVKQLGTGIVDSYLTNPNHDSEPKTLAVIDLKQAQDLKSKFNAFSSDMGGKLSNPEILRGYENALLKVQAFGTYALKSGETFEYTVDMEDYLSAIKRNNPSLASDVDPILAALNMTVIYFREDGSRPTAKGLSIYSPYTAILVSQNKVDPPPRSLLPGFMDLLELFIGELGRDTRRIPDIIEDRSGYTIPENASVTVELTFIQNTNESMIILGTEPAYPDKPGRYPFPKWGGWGLLWKDDTTGDSLVVPVKFMGSTPTGRERYEAYGKVKRDNATKSVRFDFYYEPHTGDTSYYITPYTITGKATPIFERTTWKMQPGDILTMLATHRMKGSGSERVEEYGSLEWTDSTQLGYGMLPCGYSYTIIFDVYDVTRKSIYQDYNDVEVPCQNKTMNQNP